MAKVLILTVRVMCLEGDAPSSTSDLVTRPLAGLPASEILNELLVGGPIHENESLLTELIYLIFRKNDMNILSKGDDFNNIELTYVNLPSFSECCITSYREASMGSPVTVIVFLF